MEVLTSAVLSGTAVRRTAICDGSIYSIHTYIQGSASLAGTTAVNSVHQTLIDENIMSADICLY